MMEHAERFLESGRRPLVDFVVERFTVGRLSRKKVAVDVAVWNGEVVRHFTATYTPRKTNFKMCLAEGPLGTYTDINRLRREMHRQSLNPPW